MAQSQRRSGGAGDAGAGFDPVSYLRSVLDDVRAAFRADAVDGNERSNATGAADATTDGGTDTQRSAAATRAAAAPPVDFAEMEPEDALYALLCREGGKMKQSAMVTETGWSKSKVSRRLGNLEDAGRIGRVRQGREKVVFVKPGSRGTDTAA